MRNKITILGDNQMHSSDLSNEMSNLYGTLEERSIDPN